jgi:hypothetical protein
VASFDVAARRSTSSLDANMAGSSFETRLEVL